MTAEEQLKLYESDVNAEQKIREAVTKSFGGLTEESNLIHTYENQQFPSFYGAMNGYGTQSSGLDPLTLLQNAWGEQARMATAAQVARDAFDIRKAGLDDSVKNYQNQWAMGYQGAQNAYDRWWAQKQHEDAMREAARNRAASYAGYTNQGINIPDPTTQTTEEDPFELIKKAWQAQQQYNKVIQGFKDQNVQGQVDKRNKNGWGRIGNWLLSKGFK